MAVTSIVWQVREMDEEALSFQDLRCLFVTHVLLTPFDITFCHHTQLLRKDMSADDMSLWEHSS